MKKVLSIFVILFVFASCSDDVRFNTRSVQGVKDGVFWKSSDCRASLGSGNVLTIEAVSQYEKISLQTTSTNVAIYPLGTIDANTANYSYSVAGQEFKYATGLNIGDGEIEITEFDPTNMTVSGKFWFSSQILVSNPLMPDRVSFQDGIFYRVPITTSK
jgi:hypothetical protein